jgi:hypothetical protein
MTAERIVKVLAAMQDDLGYICDDNLTLGIMGDGSSPILASGFWNTPKVPQNEASALKAEEVSNEAR